MEFAIASFLIGIAGTVAGLWFGWDWCYSKAKIIIIRYREESDRYKQLYLLSERQRQETWNMVAKDKGMQIPLFNSYLQDEIDFPDESPVFEEK